MAAGERCPRGVLCSQEGADRHSPAGMGLLFSASVYMCACTYGERCQQCANMQSNAFTEDARSVQTCKTTLSQRVVEVCKHAK